MARVFWIAVVALVVGRQVAAAQPQPPGAPLLDRPQYPVGAIAPTCRLRTQVEVTVSATAVRLKFFLVNASGEQRTATLTSTCGRMVQLAGLPAGSSPICAQPDVTKTFTVRPRGRVALGAIRVRAKGDARTPPLPLGSTVFTANIQADDPLDVCGGGSAHIVREHKTGRLRRAKPNEQPIPAVLPAPVTAPPPTPIAPAHVKPPGRECPVCAFGCPNGVPSRRVDADGCRVCACDDLSPVRQPAQ